MIVVELIIVLLAIFLGARLGASVLVLQVGWVFWYLPPLALSQGQFHSMSFLLSWRLSPRSLRCRSRAVWITW